MKCSLLLRAVFVVGLVAPPPILESCNDSATSGFIAGANAQVTYYVKPDGNDTLAGTSDATAWKSIARVNNANSALVPGSSVLFKSGGVYRGELRLNERDTVTITTYPASAAPAVLKGSLAVPDSLWTIDGDRYYADLPDPPTFVSQVFEGGELAQIARYPNSNVQVPGASFRYNSTGTGMNIVDSGLVGGADYWTGAWVVLRSANWQYDMREVLSHSEINGRDSLILKNSYNEDPGGSLAFLAWGYYLVNKLDALDTLGEWYYDASLGRLYMKSIINGQPPQDVEVVIEENGIYPINCTNIQVTNLEFSHYRQAGFQPFGPNAASNGFALDSCVFRDIMVGVRDLYQPGLEGRTISNCTFERCYLYGVRASWSNGLVDNCRFSDIGLRSGFGGVPQLPDTNLAIPGNIYGSYSAIQVDSDGLLLRGNRIERVGNNGINFTGIGAVAENNYVTEALSLVNDGAAITFDYCDGCVVRDNIVSKSIGVLEGQAFNSGNNEPKTTGIYYGNRDIKNTVVERNTVSDCSDGILIDHAPGFSGNVVRDNTIFNCSQEQIRLQDLGDQVGDGYQAQYDTQVSNNVLYGLARQQIGLSESQVHASSYDATEPLVDFGTYSGNRYYNPFNDIAVEQYIRYTTSGSDALTEYFSVDDRVIPWTLKGWNERSGQEGDPTGVSHPLSLTSERIIESLGVDTINYHSDDCSSNVRWFGLPPSVPGEEALRFTDQNFIERWQTGASSITPIAPNDTTPPGTYRFTIRARSTDTDALQLSPVWTLAQPAPERYVRPFASFSLTPEWKTTTMYLTLAEGDYFVTAFQNVQRGYGAFANSVVDVDFVDVAKVTLDTTYQDTIALDHLLRYNCPIAPSSTQNVGASFSPGQEGECWSDVHGNFYAGDDVIPLEAWGSIALFKYSGLEESELVFVNDTYTVTGEQTISQSQNIQGTIIVPDSSTLIIDGATLGFAASTSSVTTNITVETGGTLILRNGATLTSWQGCNAPAEGMWDGIKVFGQPAFDPQGWVRMESGARIANALVAILAGDADPEAPSFVGATLGGKVDLRNATFINNVHDVVLHPVGPVSYDPLLGDRWFYQAGSYFENCHFLTTSALNDEGRFPVSHVRLTQRVGTVFRGCTFANDRSDIESVSGSLELGHGLESFNSNFTVVNCGPPCADPEPGAAPNVFRNLDHGVHATSAWDASGINIVRNAQFKDNLCGVYLNGVTGFVVMENEIEMGRWNIDMSANPVELPWLGRHRGVFTTEGFGFTIQDNVLSLSSQANSGALTEGIVVGFSEEYDDIVYRNTATGLERGFVGEGICADPDDPSSTGLQFQCNTNNGNTINFVGRIAAGDDSPQLHTIRSRQGSDQRSAGNSFDLDGSPIHFELTFDNPSAPVIYYFYDSDSVSQTPNTDWTTGITPLIAVPLIDQLSACANPGPGVVGGNEDLGSLPGTVEEQQQGYTQLRILYDQMMDGGDTQALLDNMLATWWDIENGEEANEEVLLNSPFVSGEVLAAMVQSPAFTDAQKAAMLIANPEGTQQGGIMRLLGNINFPTNLVALIEASWAEEAVTYRAQLEMQMSGHHTDLVQAANHWLYLLKADSVAPSLDTLRHVWQQVRTPGARFAEGILHLAQQEHGKADTVITNMVLEKALSERASEERERLLTSIAVLHTAALDQRTMYQLDSTEVASLDSIAMNPCDRSGAWANNLLCAVYGICRPPCTGGESGAPKARRLVPPTEETASASSTLTVFPNPTRGPIEWIYRLTGAEKGATLVIRDALGKQHHQQHLSGSEGRGVWSAAGLAQGIYTVELWSNGGIIHAQRLVLQ